jgi:PTH1 family peptidyl-tRNA hydrolase
VSPPIKLIVGLGNPGPEHLMTRHNAGFWFVDVLAEKYSLTFKNETKFHAELARLEADGMSCYVCKPTTFMNCSGQAVQAIANFYKIKPEEILVVHDEIDLEPGRVRIKTGGGHGGNNGLRDVIEKLGSNAIARIRLGVGHPGDSRKVVNYVLSKPSADDQEQIIQGIVDVIPLLPKIVNGEIQKAMTELHTMQNNNKTQD